MHKILEVDEEGLVRVSGLAITFYQKQVHPHDNLFLHQMMNSLGFVWVECYDTFYHKSSCQIAVTVIYNNSPFLKDADLRIKVFKKKEEEDIFEYPTCILAILDHPKDDPESLHWMTLPRAIRKAWFQARPNTYP